MRSVISELRVTNIADETLQMSLWHLGNGVQFTGLNDKLHKGKGYLYDRQEGKTPPFWSIRIWSLAEKVKKYGSIIHIVDNLFRFLSPQWSLSKRKLIIKWWKISVHLRFPYLQSSIHVKQTEARVSWFSKHIRQQLTIQDLLKIPVLHGCLIRDLSTPSKQWHDHH